MNTQHTTGPWKAIQNPGREPCTYYVVDPSGRFCIADLPSGSTCTQANARLIAAAPELLEELRAVVNAQEEQCLALGWSSVEEYRKHHTDADPYYKARAAISKAEGRE